MLKRTSKKDRKHLLIILIILLILNSGFVIFYRTNLHCTQYTSLAIAAMDPHPHVEECPKAACPLIYYSNWAIPLRIYFSLNLFLFLFLPLIAGLANLLGHFKFSSWRTLVITLCLFFLANLWLSKYLAGERFYFLNWAGLGFGGACLIVLLLSRYSLNIKK